ncbi:MAG: hypothetical protein ACTSRG_15705 [Candidatus Helarchaeota archaeon]
MSGTFLSNQRGVYGMVGVPNLINIPRDRSECASCPDLDGDFWLFGGFGYDEASSGSLSDLWKNN